MFYKRKKVVHLNFKNAARSASGADAAHAASKETKEPHSALAEHILRLKFEKNMRKLFGLHTMCKK